MRVLACDAAPGSAAAAAELAQRMVVMRCLSGACENGQLLVDVFVNYDCDLEGANLFERAVLGLVRIAQGKQSHEGPTVPSPEEQALRLAVRSTPLTNEVQHKCVSWCLRCIRTCAGISHQGVFQEEGGKRFIHDDELVLWGHIISHSQPLHLCQSRHF